LKFLQVFSKFLILATLGVLISILFFHPGFGSKYSYHVKKKLTDLVLALLFPASTKKFMDMPKVKY